LATSLRPMTEPCPLTQRGIRYGADLASAQVLRCRSRSG
jgi:hypothetical protein